MATLMTWSAMVKRAEQNGSSALMSLAGRDWASASPAERRLAARAMRAALDRWRFAGLSKRFEVSGGMVWIAQD